MIKKVYYKTIDEYNQIITLLLDNNINIWNIHKHKGKNLISYFYNEDYQNINIGIKWN